MATRAITIVPLPSRFERARHEAATRATLSVAANVLEQTEKRIGRAHSLLAPAIGFDHAPRRNALAQAAASLKEAIAELQEVLQEIQA